MSERIVIVGGGHAAGVAAASLREQGHAGEIEIVGDEPRGPYQRPPLSKNFLAGQMNAEQLQLKPARFYDERGISLRTGARVESIGRAHHAVCLGDGTRLEYTKLLLATGARPRLLGIPGAELAGVHYLRTMVGLTSFSGDGSGNRRTK